MKRFTLITILALLFISHTSFHDDVYSKSSYYVVVDKSEYELKVFDAEGWLISFPIVLGNDDQGDKLVQGDRKTPEGTFTIIAKRAHNKWCRFMTLDYPTAVDVQKFNMRKQQGLIPPHAKIGGDIGIHGTWPREEFAVDQYQNWTQGCISLKNEHIKQFYNIVPVGTRITIQK